VAGLAPVEQRFVRGEMFGGRGEREVEALHFTLEFDWRWGDKFVFICEGCFVFARQV